MLQKDVCFSRRSLHWNYHRAKYRSFHFNCQEHMFQWRFFLAITKVHVVPTYFENAAIIDPKGLARPPPSLGMSSNTHPRLV